MDTVNYVIRPSNLPSDVPLYQPVIEDQTNFSLEDLAKAVATANGYAASTVANVLSGVAQVLPTFLSKGTVDMGAVGMRLAMTGTTTDPNTTYTASSAPLTIKVTVINKAALIASVRQLISMQRNQYVPKATTITSVENRYDVSGVPVSSIFKLLGQNLQTPDKNLVASLSVTPDMATTLYGDILDEPASSSKTSIVTTLTPALRDGSQDWQFARFSLQDKVTNEEQIISDTYHTIYGGIKHAALIRYQPGYRLVGGQPALINVHHQSGGVLKLEVRGSATRHLPGTQVTITGEGLYTLTDGATPPLSYEMYVGNGFIPHYTVAVPVGNGIGYDGYIEDGALL